MPQPLYRFGDFVLEPDERRLRGPAGLISLAPKAFDALCLLVADAGSLVGRDRLQDCLWPGGGIVADATLSKLIWQVRHALGDDGETFIQTVPRKGYRFIAEVTTTPPASPDASLVPPVITPAMDSGVATQSALARNSWRWAGIVLVALLSLIALLQHMPDHPPPALEEARRLALRADALLDRRTQAEVTEAVQLYRQAVQLAPDSAELQAGLATAIALVAGVGLPASSYDSARQHAERALQLEPDSPDALSVLGLVAMNRDADWAAAEDYFQQALTRAPQHVRAHHWLGELLVLLDPARQTEGMDHLQLAHRLAPDSPAIASDLAKAAYFSRRYEQAVSLADQVLTAEPAYPHVHRWRGLARAELGDCAAADADLRDAVALDANPVVRGEQIYVLGRCGAADKAAAARAALESEARQGYVSPMALMLARIGTGDHAAALDALSESIATGNMVLGIGVAPQLDALRDEPRLQQILARLQAPRVP